MFTKILIANRGEIAIRVMRTCREMGIKTVAVYSEADRNALHVRYADEAYLLGPPPSSQSYLLGDKIIDICIQCGAQAIHPGYGFLSENAEFARKLKLKGIVLIGPSAEAMEMMGSKIESKINVARYGVPMVPGVNHAVTEIEEAKKIALEVGFPVLIKASAGGGGKGMRLVHKIEDLQEQMATAQNEAKSAFGDGSVFIEKFVTTPRHVEIQIMADNHGNVCYLFERECSIQRRHQKLVEEAPSAVLTEELRVKMGEAAVNVARACNYSGAGTVEFLVDSDLNFYFLEMNTRLQVEHPVTEMITGIDLVKEQICVAAGKHLNFTQHSLKIIGHAIELRICAEDPSNNFLPDIGKLEIYRKPQGPGVRVDDCMEQGMEIPVYYDNMIAKLVVHADTRLDAISKMKRAISEYSIAGVKTTLHFGEFVMNHPKFISGDFDTNFIEQHFDGNGVGTLSKEEEAAAAIAALSFFNNKDNQQAFAVADQSVSSGWNKRRELRG